MRKSYIVNSFLLLFILFISAGLFSCTTTKNVKYFQDIPDSGVLKPINGAAYIEPVIQVDDILTILVQTVDPQATNMINLGNVPTPGNGVQVGGGPAALQQSSSGGYLVDKDGNVNVPVLGKIKVIGYTTSKARDLIQGIANKYFNEPSVTVRFANFKVSVTGEVTKPGQYIIGNEKVSIIDAIAMAGDLTIYGKRENVLLIRENEDGSKTPYRINLNKSNIMELPYYYLRQNDIIYVEPTKGKIAANDLSQTRIIAISSSVLSLLIIIASRIK